MKTIRINGEEFRVQSAVIALRVASNGTIIEESANPPNTSTTSATFASSTKTVAAAADAEAIGAGLVESVEVNNNTGDDILIGDVTSQPRKVADGMAWSMTAPVGKKIDLSTIFVKVTNNGDTVDILTVD